MSNVLHRQQRTSTCAVAAIRTVLHHQFGVRISESALAVLGSTPAEPVVRDGSSTAAMRRMLRGASAALNPGEPWRLRVRSKAAWRHVSLTLGRGRWPIAGVYVADQDEYHAVVLIDLDDKRVRVFDPDPRVGTNLRWVSRAEFEKQWREPKHGDTWLAVVTGGVLRT
jgi:ABC-type bacteriocin/lantibiotic exporter with double-glycine peptidase domain